MDAPKCRLCGKKHYGICDGGKSTIEPRAKGSPRQGRTAVVQEKPEPKPGQEQDREAGQAEKPQKPAPPSEEDVICEACGTNLSARDRDRERRKRYMQKKRSNAALMIRKKRK